MSDLAQDLHQAFAGVMQAHGYGLVSRLVFVAELVDEGNGELGLMRGSIPADMPVWSELGLHRYAVADIEALVTASRVAGSEEDE
ncbi:MULTISPECIES: hypothetical protein [unclassified Streptomyces]|uniref:hypothetical protein n=1 Tax=unclassified Streptomyces TaxID=2593676 RepID=UPI003D94EF21